VKGKKKKSGAELWLEKFYKKVTNLPEPFPHELVERLEQYLDVSFPFFLSFLRVAKIFVLSVLEF